jgi:prevent-host-death family protein
MQIINTFEAKTNLSKLIEQVLGGKEIIIGKAGKPVAKLVAYKEDRKPCIFGSMKGEIWIPDNFDDEDEEINKMFNGE